MIVYTYTSEKVHKFKVYNSALVNPTFTPAAELCTVFIMVHILKY